MVFILATVAIADEFVVMAGVYPPFCFNKGLYVGGVSVDAIETIMKMTNTSFDRKNIKLMPLKKAYADAEKLSRRVILNVPRTPKVENKFKWVGPIYFPRYVLIGKKGNEVTIATTDEIGSYKVGTIRGSAASKSLINEGVSPKKLKSSTTYVQPLLQLKNKQIDLIAHSDMETTYLMQKMRMNKDKYKVVYTYKKVPLYFAFSKDTDDARIKLFNDALASYKISMSNGDSAFARNVRKYLPKGAIQ